MANQVDFFIDGAKLDISDPRSLSLAVTYAVTDVNKIDTRKTHSTKTIKLPMTKRNRRLLRFPDDLNAFDPITQNEEPDVWIDINGVTVIRGRMRYMGSETKGGRGVYKVVILGNADWKIDLENRSLRDLDMMDQSHLWTKENILDAETADPARAYIYPLIDNGGLGQINVLDLTPAGTVVRAKVRSSVPDTFISLLAPFQLATPHEVDMIEFNDSGLNQPANVTQENREFYGNGYHGVTLFTTNLTGYDSNGLQTGKLKLNPVDRQNRDIKITDRIPIWKVGYLVRKIYQDIGYKVVSNFVDDKLDNAYMGFNGSLHILPEEYKVENFEAGLSVAQVYNSNPSQSGVFTIPMDLEVLPSDSYNPVTGIYTTTISAKRRHQARVVFVLTAGANVYIRIKLDQTANGGGVSNLGQTFIAPIALATNTVTITPPEKVVLQTGDKVFVEFEYHFLNPAATITIEDTSFFKGEMEDEGYPEADSLIVPSNWLPDETQLKFMQGLKHTFNLMFTPNPEKKIIYIEPRDDFYQDKVVDWSGKIDHDKKIEVKEIASSLNKFIEYKFKKDPKDTYVNEYIEPQIDKALHSAKVERTNKFAKDAITKVENPLFSPTYMGGLESMGLSISVPRIWNTKRNEEPDIKAFFSPRILYFEGSVPLPVGESYFFEGDIRTTYPKVYSVDAADFNYNSIAFDDREKSIGLFTKHYASQQKEINEARMLKAFVHLTPLDTTKFANIEEDAAGDFRNKYFIDHNHEANYFRIGRVVQYSPMINGTTKVELITAVDAPLLPKYPIAQFVCSNATTPNTQETQTISASLTIENIGGVSGNCILTFSIPTIPSLVPQIFNFVLNSGQSTVINAIWTAPVGSAGTHNVEIRGCCDLDIPFEVAVCTLPADLEYNNDAQVTPAQLQAGDTCYLTFSVTNVGCLTGTASGTASIVGTISSTVYQSQPYSVSVTGQDTEIIVLQFDNIPTGEGLAEILDMVISGTAIDLVQFFVLASNPASVPQLIDTTPDDDQTAVPPSTNIELQFNKNMQFGAGGTEIRIIDTSAGLPVFTFTSASPEVSISVDTLIVNPTTDLGANKDYHVEVDNDFVESTANVPYGGISDPTVFNFSVGSAGSQTQDVINTNTSVPYSHGSIFASETTWSGVRNKTSGNSSSIANDDTQIMVGFSTNYSIERGFLYFDTSFIPPAATITLVELHLYAETINDGDIVVLNGTQANTLTTNDFDAFNGVELGRGTMTIGAYVSITLPITSATKGGWSKFCLRFDDDYDDVAPAVLIKATEIELRNNVGKEPFLRVSYT